MMFRCLNELTAKSHTYRLFDMNMGELQEKFNAGINMYVNDVTSKLAAKKPDSSDKAAHNLKGPAISLQKNVSKRFESSRNALMADAVATVAAFLKNKYKLMMDVEDNFESQRKRILDLLMKKIDRNKEHRTLDDDKEEVIRNIFIRAIDKYIESGVNIAQGFS